MYFCHWCWIHHFCDEIHSNPIIAVCQENSWIATRLNTVAECAAFYHLAKWRKIRERSGEEHNWSHRGWPQSPWRLTEVFQMISDNCGEMQKSYVQTLLCRIVWVHADEATSAWTRSQWKKTEVCPHLFFKPFCHLCEDWVQCESRLDILEIIPHLTGYDMI